MGITSHRTHSNFFRCSSHNNRFPATSSNSLTSSGNVSSRIAAIMSGASVVRLLPPHAEAAMEFADAHPTIARILESNFDCSTSRVSALNGFRQSQYLHSRT